MSRYLQADEEKLRMQSFVRECVSSGLLEPSQSARLVADLQVDLRETNPFLRAEEPEVQTTLGMEGADPAAVFAEIRTRKDKF